MTRDPDRIDLVIHELERAWKRHPDWRLGQLIANAYRQQTGRVECDPFYLEDDKMLAGIRAMGALKP